MSIGEQVRDAVKEARPEDLAGRAVHPTILPSGGLHIALNVEDLSLQPTRGVSALRDKVTTTNGGSVAEEGGEIRVRTNTSASATAKLETLGRTTYVPGTVGETGLGIRIPSDPSGQQQVLWGAFEDDNGLGFGLDATGFFVWYEKANGGIQRTRIDDFNLDKLDGNGSSGLSRAEFDSLRAAGAVYKIKWVWYGYGSITFQIQVQEAGSPVKRTIPLHVLNLSGLSIEDPDHPLVVYVENGSATSDFSVYVGGRQSSYFTGGSRPIFRSPSESVAGVTLSTSWQPILGIRRAATHGPSGRVNTVRCFTEKMEALADSSVELRLMYAPTVAGGTWAAPSDVASGESAVEVNSGLTSSSGGTVVGRMLLSGSQGAASATAWTAVAQELGDQDALVLEARAFSGTPTLTAAFLEWRELW